MSTTDTPEIDSVLEIVRNWPAQHRFTLVQEVLKTLAPAETVRAPRRPTLAQARGLLAGSEPPPSDEEVQRWLDDRRQERYGS